MSPPRCLNRLLCLLTAAFATPTRPWKPRSRPLGLLALDARIMPATLADFEALQTPYTPRQLNASPPPTIIVDGATNHAMRVATNTVPNHNTVAFDRSDAGALPLVIAQFRIRITPPAGSTPADGLSFALASTAYHGTTGGISPPQVAEEPNLRGSVGVGFDTYQSNDLGDVSNNSLSIHYVNNNSVGGVIHQVDLNGLLTLASGQWIGVKVVLNSGATTPNITVILTPTGGQALTVVDALAVPGLAPYESRVFVGARSGGLTSAHDIDDVNVVFTSLPPVAFNPTTYQVVEEGGSATVTVTRTGPLGSSFSVPFITQNLTAVAGNDYTATNGTLVFGPADTVKTIQVPILNDALVEATAETFRVVLLDPLSDPLGLAATVSINDDDAGRWSDLIQLPLVAIHSHVLPTGEVMIWDRLGQSHLWNIATLLARRAADPMPDYDTFCSSALLTSDGRLLVTGGHNDPEGDPDHDGDGVPNAALYDPATNTWEALPDMNDGRWYPSNTVLTNGDILTMSGSIDHNYTKNLLPQVLEMDTLTWRDLTSAQSVPAHGVDLYPRLFLAPDGRVYKVGPDQDTWFLETTGTGSWTQGPSSNFGLRTYGSAIQYRPGKILILGGGDPPTASAEVIDLNAATPTWRMIGPMVFPRRQFNATLLPDGRVLITGGTSAPGFNTETGAVLPAEIFDPVTETFTMVASMHVPRVYHGTAVLQADGRVFSAGSGEGGGSTNRRDAELFSPDYLFKGARPQITSAPSTASYGRSFVVSTPNAAAISRVTLVGLPAVTHAFDQNQRFVELAFNSVPGGISVTAPANPTIAPPGYYYLFVLDANGVPSVGSIIQIAPAGVVVTSNQPLTAIEGGMSLSYTVMLSTPPTANVTLTLVADSQVSISTTTLTFTPANWNTPQSVTVNAIRDNVIEPTHTGAIRYTASSTDATYNGLRIPPTTVSITDQRFDLVGRDPQSGNIYVGTSTGTALTTTLAGAWSPSVAWVDVKSGDLNGDGYADLIGRVLQSGQWWASLSNGRSAFTTTLWGAWSPAVSWVDVRLGDLNGDGKADLVGRVASSGQWWVSLSTGTALMTSLWTSWNPSVTWADVQLGDLTGDGKADLAGRVLQSGQWWVAVSLGNAFRNELWTTWNPAAIWVDVQIGDLTGDGKADLIGRVQQSGQWWAAIATGTQFRNELWATWNPAATWVDVRLGDLNGDGKADIVGRVLQSGQWWGGVSTGTSLTTTLWATWNPAVNWVDVLLADLNGDGKSDLIARALPSGEWWAGVSDGARFSTSLWERWSPFVPWGDVRIGNFG